MFRAGQHSPKKEYLAPKQFVCDFQGTEEERSAFLMAKSQSDFINAKSFREQLDVLFNYLHNDHIRVSFERIAKLFGVSKQSVNNQYLKLQKVILPDGRPPSLTDEEISIIEQEIERLHLTPGSPIYPSYYDIFDFINLKFNKSIQLDTLRHILKNKLGDKFKICLGIALEVDRSDVLIEDIEQNLMELKEKINGYSDYADARKKS